MTAELFRVVATFLDQDGRPVSGDEYAVRLMDRDRLFDNRLGASPLSDEGRAEFIFSATDVLSVDSPGERHPDIYFLLFRDGTEIFRSDVFPDVAFDEPDDITGRPDRLTRAFGPFPVVVMHRDAGE